MEYRELVSHRRVMTDAGLLMASRTAGTSQSDFCVWKHGWTQPEDPGHSKLKAEGNRGCVKGKRKATSTCVD